MKNMLILLFLLFLVFKLNGQVPQSFKYQAVARDNSGNVLANRTVSFRISIIGGHAAGDVVYTETHTGKSTNSFGLVELEIGKGTPVTGTFSNIPWAANIHYFKVEMDPSGGTTFQNMGASQLVSVPYALLAKNVENNNDLDADPTNEIQALSINGTQISLSRNGGTIQLPTLAGGPFSSGSGITSNTPLTDNFVFGSSSLDNVAGNTDDSRFFFNKAKGAFRAGVVNAQEWDTGNLGYYSFASGLQTRATGNSCTAFGNQTIAQNDYSTAFGNQTLASGLYSTAMGVQTAASGNSSTSAGNQTKAIGSSSVAMGNQTTASGTISTSFGNQTVASGDYSTVFGNQGTASGRYATAMGLQTTAPSYCETVIGNNNTVYTPEGTTSWKENDRLFVVGNGTTPGATSDAMVILKNGQVGIGTSNPTHKLDVNGLARIRGMMTGVVATTVYRTSDGTLITGASDIRLKENFLPLQNSLEKVMKLKGVSFTWKAEPSGKRSIGFIAQEFEKVFPELVFTNENDGYKGINYAEVTAVLSEAIKELKIENDRLKNENLQISSRLEKLEKIVSSTASK